MRLASIVRKLALGWVLALAPVCAFAGGETVVYVFGRFPIYGKQPATGCYPVGGLLATADPAVFYGATADCGVLPDGSNGGGTLYRLERKPGAVTGTLTTLYTFDPSVEGYEPRGVPVSDGVSLFGVVGNGVYQWTPVAGSVQGRLTILHSFLGPEDGAGPTGSLYRAPDGTLYGATSLGLGVKRGGTIFSLTPPASGQAGWTYRILHVFTGADGLDPSGSLVGDAAGRLYGATVSGGPAGHGTVFMLLPPPAGSDTWSETILAGFGEPEAPNVANTPLLLDASGTIYATSQRGGASGNGTVFRLTPPAGSGRAWTTSILLSFTGDNGAMPAGPVTADRTGTLFGTSELGGPQGVGTVFSLSPPATGNGRWAYTDLHDYRTDLPLRGAYPLGALSITANGLLAGVTGSASNRTSGEIYLLSH